MDDYIFPHMTPELQTYLDYRRDFHKTPSSSPEFWAANEAWNKAGCPQDGPLRDEARRLRQIDSAAYEVRKEARVKLRNLIQPGLLDQYHRDMKVWMCRDETIAGTPGECLSPSGRYKLVVTSHSTVKGGWAYTKGTIVNVASGEVVAVVCRNYCSFPFHFVEGHPSGHDYLVCGEDYQGWTIVELDTGHVKSYIPPEAEEGHGFCWRKYSVSPSKRTLVVSGCYWACPEEVRFYDFTDPMTQMPMLHRDDEAETFFDWIGPDECEYGGSMEVSTVNGKSESQMTDEELDETDRLEAEGKKDLWREERQVRTWKRGSDTEVAQGYVEYLCKGWLRQKREIPEDFLAEAMLHIAKVQDPAEREALKKRLQPAGL